MFSRRVCMLALAACLCWSVALSGSDRPTDPSDQPESIIADRIVGYIHTTNRNDPSDQWVPILMVDPDRIKTAGPRNLTESLEEAAIRSGVPCTKVVFRNSIRSGAYIFPFGGTPPQNNVVDDLILPPNTLDRSLCAAQAVTSTFQPYGGPPFYNVRQQLWDNCPDDPTAHLLAQGDFEGFPVDGSTHVTTIIIDPPFFSDVNVPVYQLVQSDHPAAEIIIAGDTSDPGDIGTTYNYFYIAGTNCIPYSFGAPAYAGFEMTLYGGPGPAGSCCDLSTGSCTDGIIQASCNSFLTQSWSSSPCSMVNCTVCNPMCNIGDPDDIENEPDCYTNYNDTINRGCSNLTAGAYTSYFTPLVCGQSGCGRTGTYLYLNNTVIFGYPNPVTEWRRDADHYALDLIQDTRVTWTVSGKFPSQALIAFTLKQTNSSGIMACPEYLIESFDGATAVYDNFAGRYNAVSATTATACQDAVATAILSGRNDPSGAGPLRYMLIARPSVNKLSDTSACGIPYSFNLQCESIAPQPTGACCTRIGCIETSALACLLVNDGVNALAPYYKGDGSTCAGSICHGVPSNDLCANAVVLTCTSCVIPYDSTFAGSEGQIYGTGGAVSKDLWFDYTAPSAASAYGCTQSRIVASTLFNCYNTKLQFLKINNCSLNASQRCVTSNLTYAGTLLPIELEVGPPIVDVGGWVYGKQILAASLAAPGTCWKIRVGGLTENDYGPGVLRIDFVCQAPSSIGWDASAGRCCFWNAGTHFGNCMIAPRITTGGGPTCCATLGGYLRDSTDYFEGSDSHPNSPTGNLTVAETQGMGCATWPCPAEGEACYNAWDLNALLGGSGYGTVTRSTSNRIYFKYQVPAGTPVGSGITIDACGSTGPGFFDAAMAVYRGFNLTTGECHQLDPGCPAGTTCVGNQACTNTPYNNTELARVNDCGPQDALSAGASDRVACFRQGETNPCLCLTVVASNPTFGQIALNAPVYIGLGLKNTYAGSPRPFVDPVRSDGCSPGANFSLHVGSAASCFSCSVACPGGSTNENESLNGCINYVDSYDAGCQALTATDQNFLPIADGQTYCGASATYRTNKPCTQNADCNLGDSCITGICQGPDDNTKDYDYYRIQLTQPRRVTWMVTAAFPVSTQILESPDDRCSTADVLATQINLGPCSTTVAAADACSGYIYLSVAPAVDTGVGCGKIYYATLSLGPPSVAADSCCKGDLNNDGAVNGLDIRLWLDQLLAIPNGMPATQLDKAQGCFDVATCRADINSDYSVDLSDLAGFVDALLSSSSCVATTCGDTAACHPTSPDDGGAVSDLNSVTFGGGGRVADDFRVTSAGAGLPLERLCWYGFYFNFSSMIACAGPLGDSADDFRITVYADVAGLPGNSIANANAVVPLNLVKTDTGQVIAYLGKSVERIKYEADLPAGITVEGGGCYWLEIVNRTTGSCLWVWESSAHSGNGVSIQQAGGFPAGTSNYYSFNLTGQDQSFCLPGLRIAATDCGLPLGKCCLQPVGQDVGCSVRTQPDCLIVQPGPDDRVAWTLGGDCSSACIRFPLNDNCADATLITTGPIYSGSTIMATKDGPFISCEASCGGLCNTAPDVWYRWVSGPAGLQTTVTMCDPLENPTLFPNYPINEYTYDALMVMYTACPGNGGSQVPGGCNDDCNQFSAATNSKFVLAAGTISTNTTYWIRISGWAGNRGNFTLRVSQP